MGGGSTSEDLARRNAIVQSAINRALHREGAAARIQDLFLTRSGRYRDSTSPTSSAAWLLEHHAMEIRAARAADPSVTGLEARGTWWWIMMHAIPVARYLGRGPKGTETFREELEAENEGIRILSPIRWLSRAHSVKARHHEGSSVRRRWFWQFWTKTPSASYARMDYGSRAVGMRSWPPKRNNQMSDAATAVSGATSSQSSPALPLAAASVRRDT